MTADGCSEEDLLHVLVDRSRGAWEELADRRVAIDDPVYGWVLDGVLPDGRWNLAPSLLVAQFRDQALHDLPSLQLIPRRQVRHLNSQLADDLAVPRSDEAAALISPYDAAIAGIRDGEMVTVATEHGAIELVARISEGIRRGALSVPHGYGPANVCMLTSDRADIDPLTGMVLQSGVAVTIAPPG
jgi:anaerobic selenocysteine-containing dehydrogenase